MWSRDGKKLLCSSDRAAKGNYDVWEIALADGAATPLTTSPGDDYQPAYSPDGASVAFVTTRIDGPGVYLTYPGVANSPKVPFSCGAGQHSYTLTTIGGNGAPASRTLTINEAS